MPRRISTPVPSSLRAAFDADKAHAFKHRRLNIERLAELLGTTPATLYKWIETGSMPVTALIAWQHLTGANNVVRYLASREAAVVINVPAGRAITSEDLHELQTTLNDSVGALLKCKAREIDRDTARSAVGAGIEDLAWHWANLEKYDQPELEF